MAADSTIYSFGPFRLDPSQRLLERRGKPVPLAPKVVDTLLVLVENRGRLTDKEDLMKRVWPNTFVEEGNLTTNIHLLRKVLGKGPKGQNYIETVPRRGYRFAGEVTCLSEEADRLLSAPASAIKREIPLLPVLEAEAEEPEKTFVAAAHSSVPYWKADTAPAQALPEMSPVVISFPQPQPLQPTQVQEAPERPSVRWQAGAAVAGGVIVLLIMVFAEWLTRPQPLPTVLKYVRITNDGRDKFTSMNYGPYYGPFPPVTDGTRIYMVEGSGAGSTLAQVSATGGETALIDTPFQWPILYDLSPNGSELLLANYLGSSNDVPLYGLPLPAGAPYTIGDLRAHDAAWSPDGRSIAYANDTDLYIARRDGSQARKIAATDGRPRWIRWSPGGAVLRFTVRERATDSDSLWEISAEGKNLHPLLPGWNNPPAECCGDWIHNGRYYVFQSTRGDRTGIWIRREPTGFFDRAPGQPVPLAAQEMNTYAPVPSKDGKQVFAIGAVPRGEVLRFDARFRRFVPYLSGISASEVDFTRDGQWLTYVAYPESTLWRSRTDGSKRLQLTFPPMRAFLPRWSPDGRNIAFSAMTPGRHWAIYVLPASGGTAQVVTSGLHNEGDVGWSPDSNSLVFGQMSPFEGRGSIHVLDLKTKQTSTLPALNDLYGPRWSPDGRYIAAERQGSDSPVLFDCSSQTWRDLGNMAIGYQAWSSDSRYIYFDTQGNDSAFFRLDISNGNMEKVVSLAGVQRAASNFGPWSGLAPGRFSPDRAGARYPGSPSHST